MMNADNLMVNTKNYEPDRNKKNLYNKIFSLNQTNEKEFYSSYKYYSFHPELMKVLYDSIESYGNTERRQFELKPIINKSSK